jgi:hypothetical protein
MAAVSTVHVIASSRDVRGVGGRLVVDRTVVNERATWIDHEHMGWRLRLVKPPELAFGAVRSQGAVRYRPFKTRRLKTWRQVPYDARRLARITGVDPIDMPVGLEIEQETQIQIPAGLKSSSV